MNDVIKRARGYTIEADWVSTVASIASGHGEHGLANSLWQFERVLRDKAKAARSEADA